MQWYDRLDKIAKQLHRRMPNKFTPVWSDIMSAKLDNHESDLIRLMTTPYEMDYVDGEIDYSLVDGINMGLEGIN